MCNCVMRYDFGLTLPWVIFTSTQLFATCNVISIKRYAADIDYVSKKDKKLLCQLNIFKRYKNHYEEYGENLIVNSSMFFIILCEILLFYYLTCNYLIKNTSNHILSSMSVLSEFSHWVKRNLSRGEWM